MAGSLLQKLPNQAKITRTLIKCNKLLDNPLTSDFAPSNSIAVPDSIAYHVCRELSFIIFQGNNKALSWIRGKSNLCYTTFFATFISDFCWGKIEVTKFLWSNYQYVRIIWFWWDAIEFYNCLSSCKAINVTVELSNQESVGKKITV